MLKLLHGYQWVYPQKKLSQLLLALHLKLYVFFYGKLAIKFDNYVLVKKTNSLLQKK